MVTTKQTNYEIMYIVDDQNPELALELKKEFVEILTRNNGKINKEEDFVRQFAYEINHKVKGHYFVLEVLTSAANIADFNRVFSIKQKQGDVIRKLIINLDDEKHNTFKQRPERKEPEFNPGNREFRPRRMPSGENQEPNSEYRHRRMNSENQSSDSETKHQTRPQYNRDDNRVKREFKPRNKETK